MTKKYFRNLLHALFNICQSVEIVNAVFIPMLEFTNLKLTKL